MLRFAVFGLIAILPLYKGAAPLWYFSACSSLFSLALFLRMVSGRSGADAVAVRLRGGLSLSFIAYACALILSLGCSALPYSSWVDLYKTAAVFVAFLSILSVIERRSHLVQMGWVLMVLGAVLSFMGMLQMLEGLPRGWWHRVEFLSSVYVNHNHFAGFLELLIFTSMGLILAEKQGSRKILLVFSCALMALAFVLTLSRGGFAAASFGLAVWCVLLSMHKNKGISVRIWTLFTVLAVILGVVVMVMIAGGVQQRLYSIGSFRTDENFISRFSMWKGAWTLFKGSPLVGTGPGTFEYAFLKVRPEGFIDRPVYVHNDFLQLLSDGGIFLFLAAGFFWFLVFRKALGIIRRESDLRAVGLVSGATAGLSAFMLHALIDFNFHIPGNWVFAMIAVSIILGVTRSEPVPAGLNKSFRMALFGLSATVFAASLYVSISEGLLVAKRWDSSIRLNPWNAKAYFLRGRATSSLKDLKKASELNPLEPYYSFHAMLLGSGEDPMAVLAKDPYDPKLNFLIGRRILLLNRTHDVTAEERADRLLSFAAQTEPYRLPYIYDLLWYYYRRLEPLEKFSKSSASAETAYIGFLAHKEFWAEYAKCTLRVSGIDSQVKYRLAAEHSWDLKRSQTLQLKDFKREGLDVAHEGDFFYRNGRIGKDVAVDRSLIRIVLTARATASKKEYPVLLVKWDGQLADILTINSPYDASFFSVLKTQPGNHRLTLEFINDGVDPSQKTDRNIWIRQLRLDPVAQ